MRDPTTRGEPGPPPRSSPIQFRPGTFFQRRLDRLASEWDLSVNETAKRLALLAASGLSLDDFDLVTRLGEVVGAEGDFGRCCEQIFVAVDSANQARREAGLTPLTAEGRAQLIVQLIARWDSSDRSTPGFRVPGRRGHPRGRGRMFHNEAIFSP